MDNSILYFIFTIFSSIIATLLIWLAKKISSIESRLGVIEERISWVIKFMNGKEK